MRRARGAGAGTGAGNLPTRKRSRSTPALGMRARDRAQHVLGQEAQLMAPRARAVVIVSVPSAIRAGCELLRDLRTDDVRPTPPRAARSVLARAAFAAGSQPESAARELQHATHCQHARAFDARDACASEQPRRQVRRRDEGLLVVPDLGQETRRARSSSSSESTSSSSSKGASFERSRMTAYSATLSASTAVRCCPCDPYAASDARRVRS